MSIYKNYLGQVQDKIFDKTSHRQVKILNKLHILSLPTITLCHVKSLNLIAYLYGNDLLHIFAKEQKSIMLLVRT